MEEEKKGLFLDINDAIVSMRYANAREWEPISDKYLTLKEFATLVGLSCSRSNLARLRTYLNLVIGGNNQNNIPDIIKRLFRDGHAKVHIFRGINTTVNVEYRVAISDLTQEYGEKAGKLILTRVETITPKGHTRDMIRYLAKHYGMSPNDIIVLIVDKEFKSVIRSGSEPSSSKEN